VPVVMDGPRRRPQHMYPSARRASTLAPL
jgi:hypothetical protein